jgi:hypothetical protein
MLQDSQILRKKIKKQLKKTLKIAAVIGSESDDSHKEIKEDQL